MHAKEYRTVSVLANLRLGSDRREPPVSRAIGNRRRNAVIALLAPALNDRNEFSDIRDIVVARRLVVASQMAGQ
jgi:hypothetical protein